MQEKHITHRRYNIENQSFNAPVANPGLYLVATPIGNLGDISLRALAILAGVDQIYCEDTRVSAKLLQRFMIVANLKTYHDHNAAKIRPQILQALQDGASIALISDAGMPLISDPGYKLVRDCVAQDIDVQVIPGASAPPMALALSGLPGENYMFCGFLPAKQTARRRRLQDLAEIPAALVFFDTAPRIVASLKDIAEMAGSRQVAVTRELTKLHEEVLRGEASEVAAKITQRGGIKGEITLVVGPPEERGAPSDEEIDAALRDAIKSLSPAKASGVVARLFGLNKSALYDRAVALKNNMSEE